MSLAAESTTMLSFKSSLKILGLYSEHDTMVQTGMKLDLYLLFWQLNHSAAFASLKFPC